MFCSVSCGAEIVLAGHVTLSPLRQKSRDYQLTSEGACGVKSLPFFHFHFHFHTGFPGHLHLGRRDSPSAVGLEGGELCFSGFESHLRAS